MSAPDVLVTVRNFGARSGDYLRGFEDGIAAYNAALSAAGLVVVPSEPTDEMVAAGYGQRGNLHPADIVHGLVEALEWEHWLLIAQRNSGERIVSITRNHETRDAEFIMAEARAALKAAKEAGV